MAMLVRHYPMWLPGSGFRRKLNAAKEVVNALRDRPYENVKSQMVRQTAKVYTSNCNTHTTIGVKFRGQFAKTTIPHFSFSLTCTLPLTIPLSLPYTIPITLVENTSSKYG